MKNNKFILLLALNKKENKINYSLSKDKVICFDEEIAVSSELQLWDVLKDVKHFIDGLQSNKKSKKNYSIIIAGYDLASMFNLFKDGSLLENNGKILNKDKVSIKTRSHSVRSVDMNIICRDVKFLMSDDDDLRSFACSKNQSNISSLKCFVNTWIDLVNELNNIFGLDLDVLPISCGFVVERIVNHYLINEKNNDIVNYLKNNSRSVSEKENDDIFNFLKNSKLLISGNNIDWKKLRQGYYFDEDVKFKNFKMPYVSKLANASVPFDYASKAYYGGHTGDYVYGEVDNSLLVDIDLKAAYNTNGHLIPDFYAGLHWRTITNCSFDKVLNESSDILVNGPFTIGVAECKIDYPNNKKVILTPCKIKNRTNYLCHCDHVKLMFTDVYNAFLNGANIYIYKLYIAKQSKLDCLDDSNTYLYKLSPYGKVQDFFYKKRKQYQDNKAMNKLYKLLGNSIYGKAAQGINLDKNNKFSTITNPVIASQYTAITRLLISYNINNLMDYYKNAQLLTVTTDGFLMKFAKSVNVNDIEKYLQNRIENCNLDLWKYVGTKFFDNTYFEIKHKTIADLMVIRASFKVSSDGIIHAMSGVNEKDCELVYKTFLDRKVENDNGVKFNCSFNRKLTNFHKGNSGIGYFDTEPFCNRYEKEKYQQLAKQISNKILICDNKYGNAFIKTMNEYFHTKNSKYSNFYNHKKDYNIINYVRYLVRLYEPNKFNTLKNKYTNEEKKAILSNIYSQSKNYLKHRYSKFGSFLRAYKGMEKGVNKNLIDYVAVAVAEDSMKKESEN